MGDSRSNVIAIRRDNPCLTLQQISNRVGVTRERVRQILKSAGLETVHYKKPNERYVCLVCGTTFTLKERVGAQGIGRRFCSAKCSYEYTHPLVACDCCHQLFRRTQIELYNKSMKHSHYFCDKQCQGKWLATNYGWGVKLKPGGAMYPLTADWKRKPSKDVKVTIKPEGDELFSPLSEHELIKRGNL